MLPGAEMVQKVWLVPESMKGHFFVALMVRMMALLLLASSVG